MLRERIKLLLILILLDIQQCAYNRGLFIDLTQMIYFIIRPSIRELESYL